jgi:tetratricopeptide (TPR) repeat protein
MLLAEDHVTIGRLLQQQGESNAALEEYATALRCQPDYPAALRLRAVALLELERYEEAAQSLDRYLESASKPGQATEGPGAVADAHRLRGLTRSQLGDYPGALHDHTRALDIQPDAETYIYRGWVYLVQGAAPAAFRDFDAAVKLDPSSSEAYTGRGQARQKMGQGREAVQDVETALKLGAVTPRSMLNAAGVLAQASAEPEGRGRITAEQRRTWSQRSLSLVAAALVKVPAEQRSRFWQEHVLTDPGLEPLRKLPEFQQIAPKSNR